MLRELDARHDAEGYDAIIMYEEMLIGIGIGLSFWLCYYFGYKKGIKQARIHGSTFVKKEHDELEGLKPKNEFRKELDGIKRQEEY